jgi:hypothetical protein
MSDPVLSPSGRSSSASQRGQSFVEFALVLPMLIVLFIGIADFGRVFQAGINIEAIARNAAEVVAGDTRMGELKEPGCDATCRSALYNQLHQLAADAACDEAQRLAATTDVDGSCAGLLVVGACIHDLQTMTNLGAAAGDPSCGLVTGGTVPAGCTEIINDPWNSTQPGASDGTEPMLRYVEVRVCYRFTPIYEHIELPIVSVMADEIYLQRTRTFSVWMDY